MTKELCANYLARLILLYPRVRFTERTGFVELHTALQTSPPTAVHYHQNAVPASSVNRQYQTKELICLNCRTYQSLSSPVFHPSFGIHSCCPRCAINPDDFHIQHSVAAIWWPAVLVHFEPDIQKLVIKNLLDSLTLLIV